VSHALSFRRMHPVAQQLVGRLFDALAQEAEDLIAMDRSKMSLIERGRWSAQVMRLMKDLRKNYPEAEETTKEGREAIKRLRTPEQIEEDTAAFDALFGLQSPHDRRQHLTPPQPQESSAEPQSSAGRTSGEESSRPRREHSLAESPLRTNDQPQSSMDVPIASTFSSTPRKRDPFTFDHQAEMAEIVRRTRSSSASPFP